MALIVCSSIEDCRWFKYRQNLCIPTELFLKERLCRAIGMSGCVVMYTATVRFWPVAARWLELSDPVRTRSLTSTPCVEHLKMTTTIVGNAANSDRMLINHHHSDGNFDGNNSCQVD